MPSLAKQARGPRSPRTKPGMWLDTLTALPVWVASPVLRPWHLRWGATRAQVAGAMPGDHVVPGAQFNATRAITVGVPPSAVWPWLAQLGYRRGGFYTYDLLDNAGERSADQVIPEYQDLHVGSLIPMFHESGDLAIAYEVDALEPPSAMLWVHRPHPGEQPDSTWSWRLTPQPEGSTRLVTRMKQDYRWETPRLALFNLWLMELGDFAMERRMLQGIKARAEAAGLARV
jgi:hypothetical protein